MTTATIRNALYTFEQAANRGIAVYVSSAIVQELREALETGSEGPVLQWTDNRPPCEACRYDHCIAETPFGQFLITWKSWKDDCPTVDETPWGVWLGAFDSVDDAKTACQQEMNKRLARWCGPVDQLVAAPTPRAALKAEPEGEVPMPDHVNLIAFAFGREPWATWLRKGGCLESAHCELSDLMLAAITRWGTPAAAPVPEEPEGEGMREEQWDALLELAWDKYETVGHQGERFMWDSDFGSALDFIRQEIARHGQTFARWGTPATPPAPEPSSQALADPDTEHILRLAAIIREVDGSNHLGAAALAEAILAHSGFAGCHAVARSAASAGAGDVGELVEWIHRQAVHGPDADEWRHTATLLQQQAAELAALRKPAHSTFLDAIRLAQGCHDYSGGHSGTHGEAFQDGVGTVVAVLKQAAIKPWDSQTMAVLAVGSGAQAGEAQP